MNQIFILFSLKTLVFTRLYGIILNPIVLFWYYNLPFLSNIETQVYAGAGASA